MVELGKGKGCKALILKNLTKRSHFNTCRRTEQAKGVQ